MKKINNIVNLLCNMPTSEIRAFVRMMKVEVMNDIADHFGVNHNVDDVALAITRFGKSVKNVPCKDEDDELTELKDVA